MVERKRGDDDKENQREKNDAEELEGFSHRKGESDRICLLCRHRSIAKFMLKELL